MGSPPIPMAVDCPIPALVTWSTASYVNVPDFDTMPMRPGVKMKPGMMPTLASPAGMMPGQFGPIKVQARLSTYVFTRVISATGIPSVMATITPIPASAASMIASAANAGGTKMMLVSAPVAVTASLTVLNTGLPKCSWPPLPGVTPPTTCVP